MSTLAERLAIASQDFPDLSQADLARLCGIKAPSVNDWFNGKTKRLAGKNLLRTAKALDVRPEWLAEGIGPMKGLKGYSDSQRDELTPATQNTSPAAAQLIAAITTADTAQSVSPSAWKHIRALVDELSMGRAPAAPVPRNLRPKT